jgi:hypothetical protein
MVYYKCTCNHSDMTTSKLCGSMQTTTASRGRNTFLVVVVRMPSPQQKRRAKRREEYLLNREDKLESSRVRYNADAEQRRASAHDMYRANLEYNR